MLHYKQQGQASQPTVVLIHGLFGSLSNLKNLATHLAREGKQVISVDALNHGLSPHSETMSYLEQAEYLHALICKLKLKQVHVIGHSMGGKIALAYAQQYPEHVASVVAADIAPIAYQHSHRPVFSALKQVQLNKIDSREQALQQLTAAKLSLELAQFLLKSLYYLEDQWYWRFALDKLERHYSQIIDWPLSGQFTGPCLFIKGDKSDYIQAKYQHQILAQFPNAELKRISDTGHWLHAEKPAMFNRIVSRFLLNN